jgi:plasmid maintenance system antidote protein VapI
MARVARRAAQDPAPDFGTSERFWLGLQVDFDLEAAKRALAGRLEREVRPVASAA